jgi:hypothetical protein
VCIPLRREADLLVQVVDATGRPFTGALATELAMGVPEPELIDDPGYLSGVACLETRGWTRPGRADPSDAHGWRRLRGVPHFQDERYWILAETQDRAGYAGVALGVFGEKHAARVRLSAQPLGIARGFG